MPLRGRRRDVAPATGCITAELRSAGLRRRPLMNLCFLGALVLSRALRQGERQRILRGIRIPCSRGVARFITVRLTGLHLFQLQLKGGERFSPGGQPGFILGFGLPPGYGGGVRSAFGGEKGESALGKSDESLSYSAARDSSFLVIALTLYLPQGTGYTINLRKPRFLRGRRLSPLKLLPRERHSVSPPKGAFLLPGEAGSFPTAFPKSEISRLLAAGSGIPPPAAQRHL